MRLVRIGARMMETSARNRNGGNRVFEDQLLQIPRFQHQRKFVEAPNFAGQLYASHQVDRHVDTIFAEVIQKSILYVLLSSIVHFQNRLTLF